LKAPAVPPEKTRFLLRNNNLFFDEDESVLQLRVAGRFSLGADDLADFRILRKGIDARKKPRIRFVYTVEFTVANPESFWSRFSGEPDLQLAEVAATPEIRKVRTPARIIIVGSGPAGIFAALRLCDYGIEPVILERGCPVSERIRKVERFWKNGELDEESNVQFGEGGAGTFSDGKLTTRVRDPNSTYVLERLVEFGAPPEIQWLAKPHIGTDRLRLVLLNIRRFLQNSGTDIRFGSKLTGFSTSNAGIRSVTINNLQEEPCDRLLLAPGHSARDTYEMLSSNGTLMEQKAFAVGLRVEHPQELINMIQYGNPSDPRLPPADYALAWNDAGSGRSAYSFCMCPGGEVIASSSESGGVVTNGMSDLRRGSGWANSALVATVKTTDFENSSPLAGISFQRALEAAAFRFGGGGYNAPAQKLTSFLGKTPGGALSSTYRPGIVETELSELFPAFITATLKDGIADFGRKMRGFITSEATLIGVESRTSAPLRIIRGEDFQSLTVKGLYPCGEGAGYAGGIMSSALDGIRVADAVAKGLQ
jgi:uncharacterized FAD-dependent dehydrogenase